MDSPRNLRPDAFAGTARAYQRYRPPYPRGLLDDLLARARLPERPRLVDLACGPGRIALDLAPAFERVIAIDLEPEMIEVGREEAERRGLRNIEWRVGRAEEVRLKPASIDLITIGEAFHRLDQRAVVELAKIWLKPGGVFATMGTSGLLSDGPPAWKQAVADVSRRWSERGGATAVGRPGNLLGPGSEARVVLEAGFADVANHDFLTPWTWDAESVVGYLRSTSVCSEQALGNDNAAFEAEVRAALNGDGPFVEDLRAGYTFARWPG